VLLFSGTVAVAAGAHAEETGRDGFYLRFGSGLSYAGTSIDTDQLAHPGYQVDGLGLSFDAWIGGSPLPRFATGGAISFATFAFGDDTGSGNLLMLGPFVDAFPVKTLGLHLGGMLGVASIRTSTASGRDEFAGGGIGAAIWCGYDFSLSGPWALGGLLRLQGALGRDPSVEDVVDSTELSSSTYEIALLFTALRY
jgi:hypothetical protein